MQLFYKTILSFVYLVFMTDLLREKVYFVKKPWTKPNVINDKMKQQQKSIDPYKTNSIHKWQSGTQKRKFTKTF